MQESDLPGLVAQVLWAAFALGAVFGATAQHMESLTFVAPFAHTVDWLILFSVKSRVLTICIVSTLGVIAGSAAVALWTRSFHWEGFAGTEDTASHLVGAALMGVGGVTALRYQMWRPERTT